MGSTGTPASENRQLGCLCSCLHRILPTWSFSILPATVTQIFFQRAGAELELSGWCVAIIHSAPLSGNSPTHLSATETTLQDRAGTEDTAQKQRETPPQVQSSSSFRARKVVCSAVRVPNGTVLRAPFPTTVFPSSHHGKTPLPSAL